MASNVKPWAYSDDLYRAIGRAAVMSTKLDEALTSLIDKFVVSEVVWRIILGQSTDWSLQALRILLEETDPYYRIYTEEQHRTFLDLLDRADKLRHIRDRVVHGTWSDSAIMDEKRRPRPWGNVNSDPVLYVFLGKNRRGYEEQEMTISDIDRLSDDLVYVRNELFRVYGEMTNSKW